jgi:ABC-type glycerol-3-phosphate transport system permease component
MTNSISIAAHKQPRRRALSWTAQERIQQAISIIVLSAIGLTFVFPYFYMAISSLREPFYNYSSTELSLWPRPISPAGFDAILTEEFYAGTGGSSAMSSAQALLRGLGNTMFQEVFILAGVTVTSLLAAYAFAKLEFVGRTFLFYLLLSAMVIPAEVTLVPKYVMFSKWGFIGTHWALIVPAVMGAGGWFLMRMFLSTIPNDYIDAARIDGASDLRIALGVIAPLALPVILANALFTFLGVWNDLMGPLLYVNVKAKFTVQLVLYQIQANYSYAGGIDDPRGTRMQSLFAGLILGSIPSIILFIIFQRHITEGTIISGLKM